MLFGTVRLPVIRPALVAWVYLPSTATCGGIPDYPFQPVTLVWAPLFGPPIGPVAAGLVRLTDAPRAGCGRSLNFHV